MFDGRKNEHFLEKNVFFSAQDSFVIAKQKQLGYLKNSEFTAIIQELAHLFA